eukprot:TRINITY_DN5210_c0_g2_i2.p1 TRINITY_DN5210_c0_g2~~TRINITY_DN5210_c0_g2_i2.p1  ORF type:complete len:154 (-),score=19.84 TRINITY_DN5210_c0_g2_i2:90-551(-)
MVYISVPLILLGTFHLIRYGFHVFQVREYMIVGIVGVAILQLYFAIVIGFNGIARTPVPFLIGVVGVMYVPWYLESECRLVSNFAVYADLVAKDCTMKESCAINKAKDELAKKGVEIKKRRSLGNVMKFFCRRVPGSELCTKIEPASVATTKC